MSIRKHQRPTDTRLKRETNKLKKVVPIWINKNLTKAESAIANYEMSIIVAAEKHDVTTTMIKFLLYVYQFEFFDTDFCKENFLMSSDRHDKTGTRRASLLIADAKRREYIELYKTRAHKFIEEEDRFGYKRQEEKLSNDVWRISELGISLVKSFYVEMFKTKPKYTSKTKRILIWSQQQSSDFNDWESLN
jgi:hypothetical protein